ncbi:MAG: hypothetical protein IT374_15745 [Polyangiaceae bacterium]|nr:hypothetical protein [Polyangiaceae bacterium]
MARRVLALAVAALVVACTVGDGEGSVTSDDLKARDCFRGPFDLGPTFFASNPYRDQQLIRIQRGDDLEENSDGVMILVRNTGAVRGRLGQALEVGLGPGVAPPGIPIKADADPPLVGLTVYLHQTCHGKNVALYAVEGTITFSSLFSGDPNERDGGEKLSEGTFDVLVGDPRDQPSSGAPIPSEALSRVRGSFRFYFQRGQPAQPFG